MMRLPFVLIILIMGCSSGSSVCFDHGCVSAEIPNSEVAKMKGLMFRESLDGAMLFSYDSEDQRTFWMKNMKISIDIIWVNKDLEIVDIQTVPPCFEDPCPLYDAPVPSQYVIELPEGYAKENNILVGDKVEIHE